MTGKEIRSEFLKYFQEKGHKILPSSSLIPEGDPTILFTNAGMNQFKKIFTGEEDRGLTRAATVQKCMRAGGKHNDLENVGHTRRHHTFFEMLGNFSFGDYFKKDAIRYAWELLVKRFGLDPDRLWITVFQDDDEAYSLWRDDISVDPGRIIRADEKDNFWMMGETGPCGPCSEILIDQGPEVGCGKTECRVGCDCDRYLELWNLVFMEFNRKADGTMAPLPRKSIDTGMGLERIAAALQGKASNYESDLFTPIVRAIEEAVSGPDSERRKTSIQVVADHSRATTFMVADGIVPANEGRGYVLRRIIRRASRHLWDLGIREPFLFRLTGVVAGAYSDAYPELREREIKVARILQGEEERFLETIGRGMELLGEEMQKLGKGRAEVLPGEVIFRLYDTYGFPVDLTTDIVREKGLEADLEGFEREMGLQRRRGKESTERSRAVEDADFINGILEDVGPVTFRGYETLDLEAEIGKIIKDGGEIDSAGPGDGEVGVITRETPCYGEVGGQVGDTGRMDGRDGSVRAEVVHTERPHTDLFLHQVKVEKGTLRRGDRVVISVDRERREAIARNHTSTHLLQAALRRVRGDEVRQSGSLVAPDRLRFDFTCFSPLKEAERERVEDIVNEMILRDYPVTTRVMSYEEGIKSGAIAIFEEKYGGTVRLVEVDEVSRELCGGTHVGRTGEIGLFKILSETGVAAGIRRIEAVTGLGALTYLREIEGIVRESGEILKAEPRLLPERIQSLRSDLKSQEKEIERLKMKALSQTADDILDRVKETGGIRYLAVELPGLSPPSLREAAEKARGKIGSGVVVLGSKSGTKASLVVMVSKDLASKYDAVQIIRNISSEVGGGGGGRPDMAQAGGSRPEGLSRALDLVESVLKELTHR